MWRRWVVVAVVVLLALVASPYAARGVWAQEEGSSEWTDDASSAVSEDELEDAEDGGIELDDESRELGAHPDIQTFVHFPNNPDNKFSQGEEVVVLVGFHNGSPQHYFNVSHIGAQLHSPFDFSYFIQNFTVREMETIVGPGQEATVEYRFRPDPLLEPVEFQLSGWVIYNGTDGRVYQSTYFNQTIELLEKRDPWSIATAFSSIVTLAVFIVSGYYGYQFLNEGSKKRTGEKKIYRPVSTGVAVRGAGKKNKESVAAAAAAAAKSNSSSGSSDESSAADEDTTTDASGATVNVWKADNVYTPSSKAKVASRKSGSKKASKKH